jgi:hypothetical protein
MPELTDKYLEKPIEAREIRGTRYYNFSGRQLEEILNWFPHDFHAEKIVLLPDLCPGKSPLPTGCAAEVDPQKQPNWRKFAISDVGCGIRLLKTELKWDDFESNLALWDKALLSIKENKGKLGDLGSGNHFLDAAADRDENIYFVIHTGSRDESEKASELVDKPSEFDKAYTEITNWARSNREAVSGVLEKIYGKLSLILDKPHNSYEITGNGTVIIRKGAVKLRPGELTVIPSTMDDDMVLAKGTGKISEVLDSMSHGTGRVKSRSESKEDARSYDFAGLRKRIYIPQQIPNSSILTENPSCYRKLDDCLALIKGLVEEEKRLSPVAYIGQI